MSPVDHYLEQASRSQQAGDWPAALAACRMAAAMAPADPQVQGMLGATLLQMGQAAEALPLLQQAVAKLRRHSGMVATLAQALFSLARYGEEIGRSHV